MTTEEIRIIFEDSHLLVLNKPPGLIVTRSETSHEKTLEDWLEEKILKPASPAFGVASPAKRGEQVRHDSIERQGIVHRIDKETSGLLLVAKTLKAFENLQAQFKSRVIKKEYIALVHGLIEKAGVVEGGIGRNPGNREKFTVLEDGREASTEYEPVERLQVTGTRLQEWFPEFNKIQMRKLERQGYGSFSLLKCRPLTGRTHQIRVHLKYIGYPIVSDEKYVGRKMFRLDKRWCPRMFLHAGKLGFKHPETGKWMEMESKLPEDLKKTLDVLK